MKLFNIAAALATLAFAADELTQEQIDLQKNRESFEEFVEQYSQSPVKYTEAEKELQQRLVDWMITLFGMEFIDMYTPSQSHKQSDQNRGNDSQQVTRHGKTVQLDLKGAGWDDAYEFFYKENDGASNDDWNLGVRFEMNTEFDLSWRLPIYVNEQEDITMFEFAPILHLDVNAWATIEFHFYFINIRLEPWIQPYSFTPFDISIKIDPVKPRRWCYGMDYYGEATVLSLEYSQDVDECYYGLFGHLFNVDGVAEATDCQWKYYKPETSLFKAQLTDGADFFGSYIPYKCMNWYSADWDDWPLSQETISQARIERLIN